MRCDVLNEFSESAVIHLFLRDFVGSVDDSQIVERLFQAFMSKPSLYLPNRNMTLMVTSGSGLSKSVQVEFLPI